MRYPEDESSTVEWKKEFPQNDQIVKTIIGFCNQSGGKLIVGVANDGTIVGLPPQEIQKGLETLDKSIFDAAHPTIIPRIYSQRFEDKSVLIIEVSPGMSKPYYRKAEGVDGGTYIRVGRSTLKAPTNIIDDLRWQSLGLHFETLPCYRASEDDLDRSKIQDFLDHRKNEAEAKCDDPIMRAYHLIILEHSKNYPTNAGLLLFGKNTQSFFSEAVIICTHYQGTSGREAIASVDCKGVLFHQFKQAYAFVTSRLSKAFKIRKPIREETLEIPEVAIRETILNALIHRNYHIEAPIKISIYDDRVEIYSPGGFPGPLNIKNLKAGITYLRNPQICGIFREAKYVEKLGTGFIAMFDSYEKRGLAEPQIFEGENYVKCILPRNPALVKPQKENILDKLFALSDEVSMEDVQHILGVSRSTALRRLRPLISSRKIERKGKTKNVRFHRIA